MALILEQITGLQDGYDLRVKRCGNESITRIRTEPRIDIRPMDRIFLLNLIPDLDVLEEVMQKKSIDRLLGEGSCSAVVLPLADGSDLLMAHNMWSSYRSMLRFIKKYDFRFHWLPNERSAKNSLIPGHCMSFSSYPGAVLSLDDFYILSSGLVVQETTFEILNNQQLWSSVRPNGKVFEFIRVLVANRLSASGKEWSEVFGRHNSGTYNSQFMVVDYKLFTKGQKPDQLSDHLLWVCEQLPDLIVSGDMTQVLRQKHYWPSYNIPFFEQIYDSGGYPLLKQAFGKYFSYDECARALIFGRDVGQVNDLNSLMALMRANNFTTDPFSQYPNCRPAYSADLAIAARNDLNDPNGVYAIPVLGFRARGAIDAKVTSSQLVREYSMLAVSGPTHQSLPPFQWSASELESISHEGQPDLWQFEPIRVEWFA